MPYQFSAFSDIVRDLLKACDLLLNPPPGAPALTAVELELLRAYIGRLHERFILNVN
jgi:hypothetical protein